MTVDSRPPAASCPLSVIVPLAPGETEWQGLLQQLTSLAAGSEVIVVHADDESWPAPPWWPMHLRYRECRCQPGRARQQNLGAGLASGHWLWFLHADSRLRPDSLRALQRFLAEGVDALGWFQLAFRRDGPRWTVLNAAGANLRSRWLGLPFGDQGLVLPRHCFEALRGFDEQAPYGEDHLLVWAARHAALPLRRIPAVLETSARKYARQGWLATTLGHWQRTVAQAWPAWRMPHRARDMPAALAIFVKTPGLSPVKTRLAAVLGTDHATRFYRLAAAATADVVRSCQPALMPYWAVAEAGPEAAAAWRGFDQLAQGEGDLGQRLDHVYATLQARHGQVLLIGADAPQLTPAMLRAARAALDDPATPFVLGGASDGGFWLFGGRLPIPKAVWCAVRYSQAGTASELRTLLAAHGEVANLPMLTDVDTVASLPALAHALATLADPLPAQRALQDWLHTTLDRRLLTGTHA